MDGSSSFSSGALLSGRTELGRFFLPHALGQKLVAVLTVWSALADAVSWRWSHRQHRNQAFGKAQHGLLPSADSVHECGW